MSERNPDWPAVAAELVRQTAAMGVLFQALIATHPDKARLLEAFDHFATARADLDQTLSVTDTELERVAAAIAAWRTAISRYL